ncbi:MAG: subunit of meta cleavage enzyme [Candidatus Binatia bacterium]
MSDYRVNRLIQQVCHFPDKIAELNAAPERVFDEYGLSEEERAAFREGSLEAMGKVGVHPILQMHWMMARNPEVMRMMSILDHEGLVPKEK